MRVAESITYTIQLRLGGLSIKIHEQEGAEDWRMSHSGGRFDKENTAAVYLGFFRHLAKQTPTNTEKKRVHKFLIEGCKAP